MSETLVSKLREHAEKLEETFDKGQRLVMSGENTEEAYAGILVEFADLFKWCFKRGVKGLLTLGKGSIPP
eukprot:9548610-Alexandrium_andersonii.AAC.1